METQNSFAQNQPPSTFAGFSDLSPSPSPEPSPNAPGGVAEGQGQGVAATPKKRGRKKVSFSSDDAKATNEAYSSLAKVALDVMSGYTESKLRAKALAVSGNTDFAEEVAKKSALPETQKTLVADNVAKIAVENELPAANAPMIIVGAVLSSWALEIRTLGRNLDELALKHKTAKPS